MSEGSHNVGIELTSREDANPNINENARLIGEQSEIFQRNVGVQISLCKLFLDSKGGYKIFLGPHCKEITNL